MQTIDHLSHFAHQKRSEFPKSNSFNISELQKLPKFYNWVSCHVTEDIDFQMFLGGGDDGVAMRFFWNGGYEKFSLKLWTQLVGQTQGMKIDVGAHTGAYTLAAHKAAKSGTVISFEPHFMNFARLSLNARANNFPTKHLYMIGVGDKCESSNFAISTNLDYLTTGGAIGTKPGGLNSPINVVALDDFIHPDSHAHVGIIKIDVEGYEAKCLTGAMKMLTASKPIIFFECIDDAVGSKVQSMLEPLGYRFAVIDDRKEEITETNYIKSHRDDKGNLIMSQLNRIATIDMDGLKNSL
jgi:FkbM family methyltransferase